MSYSVFICRQISCHISSYSVTLPQWRHNPQTRQALESALVICCHPLFQNPDHVMLWKQQWYNKYRCCINTVLKNNSLLIFECFIFTNFLKNKSQIFWYIFWPCFWPHLWYNFCCRWKHQLVINWSRWKNNKQQTPGPSKFGPIIINQTMNEQRAIGINGVHMPHNVGNVWHFIWKLLSANKLNYHSCNCQMVGHS